MTKKKEAHSGGLDARAEKMLDFASHAGEMYEMLGRIRRECGELRGFFLTGEEVSELRGQEEAFEEAMRSMAFYTSENLKIYQMTGWEQLAGGEKEDEDDGGTDP